jgi:hypothetical protein
VSRLVEVLNQVLRHHNFSLQSLFFGAGLLGDGGGGGGSLLDGLLNSLDVLLADSAVRHLRSDLLASGERSRLLCLFFSDASLSLKLFGLGEQLGPLEFVLLRLEFRGGRLLLTSDLGSLGLKALTLKALPFDALLRLAKLLQSLCFGFFVIGGTGCSKFLLLVVEQFLLLEDALFLFTSTAVIFLLLAATILFFLALASFHFFFDAPQASFFLLAQSLHALSLSPLKGAKSLSLLLLEGGPASGLLLVEARPVGLLLAAQALQPFLLFQLELGATGILLS